MAPAGGLALGGAGRDGAGEGIDGLAFGNDGSVGPAPGEATGLPWMRELHPPTSVALSRRPASSIRPPAIVVVTLCGNIAKPAYATSNASDCSDAPRVVRLTSHCGIAVGQTTQLAGAVTDERRAVHQRQRRRCQLCELLQRGRKICRQAGGMEQRLG